MNSEKLSARQLSVAVLVGGLSPAAALAGGVDWRWALAAVPLAVRLGWLLLRKTAGQPLFCGVGGGVLAVLYGGWAVILMAATLRRAAERIQITNAGGSDSRWILLLIVLPLLWMGWGKAAAFFRAVEIFWLALIALLTIILVFALPRIEWRWLLEPAGSWRQSWPAMLLTMSTELFVLPYIYKVECVSGDRVRSLGWLGGLGVLAAALAAVTAGVLSPRVAEQLKEPFFVGTGVLGNSVRGEGLISTLWLRPDLTLAG
ncbi:MAG: hypothetical protein IJ484_07250, partial [Oscillospiraceae bacterium]|nr:hypothetical protein [Oscillospiraceae bacterium]